MAGASLREEGDVVLTNKAILKKPVEQDKTPLPKTPYELVAGQDPERRRVLREHQING